MKSRNRVKGLLATLIAAVSLAHVPSAQAETIIKQPNAHPDYRVELEPHLDLVLFRRGLVAFKDQGRDAYFGAPGFGGGFRASIELGDPAFLPKLNDTVAISFGIDATSCSNCRHNAQLYFPIALQWNFYVFKQFNVFGEVGPLIRTDFAGAVPDLYVAAGGRVPINDAVAFTFRLGYPFITLGASFFAG